MIKKLLLVFTFLCALSMAQNITNGTTVSSGGTILTYHFSQSLFSSLLAVLVGVLIVTIT